jgi:Rrf2 family iron-sulfur cluster assembly transcriptional regulator
MSLAKLARCIPDPCGPRILERADLYLARRVFRLPDSPGGSRLPLLARTQLLAIAAVTDIAINARDGLVSAKDIAVRLDLPRRYLEPLLQALTRNGILATKRGGKGGYRLARSPLLISVADILHALSEAGIEVFGDDLASSPETQIVIAALRPATQVFSEALQRLTIDAMVRYAEGNSPTG